MYALLIVAALLLIAATLIPLSRKRQWYIRALDFPRLQIASVSLLWLAGWSMHEYTADSLLLVCAVGVAAALAYQLFWIYPNTQLHDVEVERYLPERQKSLTTISLLSSNVLMHNRNAEALLALARMHQPDILITLESDEWWQTQLDILDSYPHRLACPLDNLYGMHVYSKFELIKTSIEYLVESDKPSMSMQIRLDEQRHIKLHVVHPAPPAPSENDESTERDVELIVVAKAVAKSEDPVIVAGDLNDVAWSATTRLFREISGLKDPRVGRGLFNTFNAQHWFVRWPLDHIFVSTHFRLMRLQRLPDIGSDHFPLFVELALMQTSIAAGTQTQSPTDPELLQETLDTEAARNASMPT